MTKLILAMVQSPIGTVQYLSNGRATPGARAQETSRPNQCRLVYTQGQIYDKTLTKAFIFHHP